MIHNPGGFLTLRGISILPAGFPGQRDLSAGGRHHEHDYRRPGLGLSVGQRSGVLSPSSATWKAHASSYCVRLNELVYFGWNFPEEQARLTARLAHCPESWEQQKDS